MHTQKDEKFTNLGNKEDGVVFFVKKKMKRALACLAVMLMVVSVCGNFALADDVSESNTHTEVSEAETSQTDGPEETMETSETETDINIETEESETVSDSENRETETSADIEETAESETTETENETAETEDLETEIADWTWVDDNKMLVWSDENQRWELALGGLDEDNPLTADQLLEMLPKAITVQINGEIVEIPITWDLSNFNESGIDGELTVPARLPDGYTLGAEAAVLAAVIIVDEPMTLASQENLAAHTVEGVSPQGTTINVFDYWVTNMNDADDKSGYAGNDERYNLGINAGEVLKFGRGMGTADAKADLNESTVNAWTGNTAVRQGIVASTLLNGYPALSSDLGGGSLDYLFDPTVGHAGKAAYTDAQGLLQVDSEGYFYYNSQLNFAEFSRSTKNFTLYDEWAVYAGGGSPNGQFFPFNTGAQVFTDIENNDITANTKLNSVSSYRDENGNTQRSGIDINHYFGLTMSTRFIQQYGGHTDDTRNREVTYEFSGDDDVWVFIDDVLVADLGGIHDKASLTINFSTGEITIFNDANNDGIFTDGETEYEHSDLRSKYNEAGALTKSQWAGNTYADDTYHTLDFYYLERGNTDSNMRLKFNLVTVPESSLIKVDQTGTPIANVVFNLYLADINYDVAGAAPLATGTTGTDGSFIFMDGDQILSLDEIYHEYAQNGTVYLVLREQSAPAGYRNLGDVKFRLEDHNGHVIPLSSNQWSSGAYAMANVTVTADPVIHGVNGERALLSEGGRMFAVVLKRISGSDVENSQWGVLTGDVTGGWTVTEVGSGSDGTINEILDTVRKAPENYFTFLLDASGAFKATISDLPGDVTKYYYMLGSGEKDNTEYTIAYYYTSAANISGANADNTWRVNNEDFSRVFSANIYVPNIKNHLLVQKVDDIGNTVDGAVFNLYKASEVEDLNGNFSAELLASANPYDTVTTYTGQYTEGQASLSLQGGAVFPSNDTRRILEKGTYYLVERSAPDGYVLNSTPVRVIVDDAGVYADAGAANDGVVVFRGVGSIVKSMLQFTNATLDATLRDIKAALVTGSVSGDNTLTWNQASWNSDNVLHLVYDGQHNNALEYGSYDEDGSITVSTDEGWSKLEIQQCYQHDNTVDTSLKTDLGTADITGLFSGSVTVQVTNDRVGALHISKTVDGDERPEDEQNRSFEFTVTLLDSSRQPISGTYLAEKYLADGTVDATLTSLEFNSQGQATVNLADGESIDISELPTGASYTVTETAVSDYETSCQVDGGEITAGSTASGTIPQNGSSTAAFTNTYRAKDNFSFIKTDSSHEPLEGASFGLYRLICTDDSHDHSQELISVGDDGVLDSAETSCWTLVDTITTGDDGLAEFKDIFIDGTYRLVEYANPGGYTLPKGQWVVTYTNSAFQVTGSINNPPAFEKLENAAAPYRVINYKPQELPVAGSRGMMMFGMIGGGLMGLGALGTSIWYVMRKRRYAYRKHR